MPSLLRGRSRPAFLVALLFAGAAMLVTMLHAGVARASGSSPYEKSSIVESIKWNEKSKHNLGRGLSNGADIWQTTWGSDGNLYSAFGDGDGLEGSTEVQIGLAKLEGTPTESTNITGKNVYLGEAHGNTCNEKPTKIDGKPHGTVALAGEVIYMYHWAQARAACHEEKNPNPQYLAKSTDNGKEWKDLVGGLKWPDKHGFYPGMVVKYGEINGGALAPESSGTQYVYIYGKNTKDTGAASAKIYLARVPETPTTDLETEADYQYYEGLEEKGSPKWGTSSEKAAVVLNDENGGGGISVTFDKGIGRYIVYDSHEDVCEGKPCEESPERAVSLFDGASPWGPWTTVTYENQFDNTECGTNCLGNDESDSFELPQKWMSASGLTAWSLYSGYPGAYDSLNLIEGTMSLASSGSSVDNISVATVGTANGGSPAVTSHLSTTNPEDKLFIDRTYRFVKIPTAYKGLEQVRLANTDKAASASKTYLSFTVTKKENVCVGLDNRITVPSWLSSWTKQAAEDNIEGEPPSGENAVFNVYKKEYAANATVSLPGLETTNDQYIVFVGC